MLDENDVDVKVWWGEDESDRAAVMLTHKPTGITVESREQETQIANYEAAMAELERKVAALETPPS